MLSDRRFTRLGRDLYGLARWAGAGGDLERLRSIPLQPAWILSVLERLVVSGTLTADQIQGHLTGLRQAGRSQDYVNYLVCRGWARMDAGGVLLPTTCARDFVAAQGGSETRVVAFALTDANFQAYLMLLFTEYLVRAEWRGRRREEMLKRGPLAPLQTVYDLMKSRMQMEGSALGDPSEQELRLLANIRAPGMPQVFSRWVEPALGVVPSATGQLVLNIEERIGAFPTVPSRVVVDQIPGGDARLLLVAVALAAEDDSAVDYQALHRWAHAVGLACRPLSDLARDLLVAGVFVDDRDPARVKVLSPHTLFWADRDMPATVEPGPPVLRDRLWREGVLTGHCPPNPVPPSVQIEKVQPPDGNPLPPADWESIRRGEPGSTTRSYPCGADQEQLLVQNMHLMVLHQLLIVAMDDPVLIRPSGQTWVLEYNGAHLGPLGQVLDDLVQSLRIHVWPGGEPPERLAGVLVGWLLEQAMAEQVYGQLRLTATHEAELYRRPYVDRYIYGGQAVRARLAAGLDHLAREVRET